MRTHTHTHRLIFCERLCPCFFCDVKAVYAVQAVHCKGTHTPTHSFMHGTLTINGSEDGNSQLGFKILQHHPHHFHHLLSCSPRLNNKSHPITITTAQHHISVQILWSKVFANFAVWRTRALLKRWPTHSRTTENGALRRPRRIQSPVRVEAMFFATDSMDINKQTHIVILCSETQYLDLGKTCVALLILIISLFV